MGRLGKQHFPIYFDTLDHRLHLNKWWWHNLQATFNWFYFIVNRQTKEQAIAKHDRWLSRED